MKFGRIFRLYGLKKSQLSDLGLGLKVRGIALAETSARPPASRGDILLRGAKVGTYKFVPELDEKRKYLFHFEGVLEASPHTEVAVEGLRYATREWLKCDEVDCGATVHINALSFSLSL